MWAVGTLTLNAIRRKSFAICQSALVVVAAPGRSCLPGRTSRRAASYVHMSRSSRPKSWSPVPYRGATGAFSHILRPFVYRPAEGAGHYESRRLRLGGKRLNQQSASVRF
jgi:hypothetical protein